jgi:hypothetical protein
MFLFKYKIKIFLIGVLTGLNVDFYIAVFEYISHKQYL